MVETCHVGKEYITAIFKSMMFKYISLVLSSKDIEALTAMADMHNMPNKIVIQCFLSIMVTTTMHTFHG